MTASTSNPTNPSEAKELTTEVIPSITSIPRTGPPIGYTCNNSKS